jgi:glycosyltransferase involved in cell wall biosynthesis
VNVLFSVPWDNLGGVCGVVNAVALHMQRQGHNAYLLLPSDENELAETTSRAGLPAFRLNVRSAETSNAPLRGLGGFLKSYRRTQRVLRTLTGDLGIDVINVHFVGAPSLHLALTCRKSRSRLVTSIHGADLLPYNKATPEGHHSINYVLKHSSSIIAPSRAFAEAATQRWPVLEQQTITVIPNGVDISELGYDADAPWTESASQNVLSIAALVPYKGIDILINAFALIADEFPDVRLKLVSGGPAAAQLAGLAAHLGLGQRIEFLGAVDRPRIGQLLREATVFVLASRSHSESFGIAAVEAMALDRPVIASSVGALPDIIEHDRTGMLVPPGDPQALADAMRRALANRQLREQLGRAAGLAVRGQYLWSRTGAEYESLLTSVAAQS